MISGLLLLDKPKGLTSFDVIREVRRRFRVKKIGHTGTLDPLATGVLPLCLGEATKIAGLLTANDKRYRAGALLGVQTNTYDITGDLVARSSIPENIDEELLRTTLRSFRGDIAQIPPAFSAIRVDGERAYEKARRGESIELAPRDVHIYSIELVSWDSPHVVFDVHCSKGTYVRSLVSDFGMRLGSGATMESLTRTATGIFTLDQCVSWERLHEANTLSDLPLLTLDQALSGMPVVDISPADWDKLYHGQPIDCATACSFSTELVRIRLENRVMALGVWRMNRLWPKRIFHYED